MATTTPTLTEIREAAQRLADARRQTVARAKLLEEDVRAAVLPVYEGHRPGIDAAAEEEVAARDILQALLDGAPGLFVKPRSLVVDGVRCGYRKEADGLEIDDAAAVIGRIRSLPELADLVDVLVRTEETLNLGALDELSPKILRRIGARRVVGADASFITFGDTDVEKMAKAILADAAKRQGEEEPKAKKGKTKAGKAKEAA